MVLLIPLMGFTFLPDAAGFCCDISVLLSGTSSVKYMSVVHRKSKYFSYVIPIFTQGPGYWDINCNNRFNELLYYSLLLVLAI